MRDHSDVTLRAVITCLRDTVAPAVDASDPQAVEQLRLSIDFLEFLHERVYDIHPRCRLELRHQIATAHAVESDAAAVSPDAAGRLAAALAAAESVLGAPDTTTRMLRATAEALWAAVRGVVRSSAQAPEDVRHRISVAVRDGMAPLLQLESAWYLPLGFEGAPQTIPPLDQLLPP